MLVPSQGHYVFTVFWLLTDFVCLYNYEFWLSLCKIVRSSVILLLPLWDMHTHVTGVKSTDEIAPLSLLITGSPRFVVRSFLLIILVLCVVFSFVFVFFSFVSVICFVYPTLLEFLEYPFFIAPSVFYNVYLQRQYIYKPTIKTNLNILVSTPKGQILSQNWKTTQMWSVQ